MWYIYIGNREEGVWIVYVAIGISNGKDGNISFEVFIDIENALYLVKNNS